MKGTAREDGNSSMKIAVASDLHLEMRNEAKAIIRVINRCIVDADVLVLAGDIISGAYIDKLLPDVLWAFCQEYDEVIYVPGNHEYWHSSFEMVNGLLRRLEKDMNLRVLLNEGAVIDGVSFYGGPLWFPKTPEAEYHRPRWSDFVYIDNDADVIYEQSALFRANFPVDGVDIAISHHLPYRGSVARMYQNSPINCYFVNDVQDLMAKSKVWIHGHTHTACDYERLDCRVICNPLGAPRENSSKKYSPLVFDV
jgi:predicted phosphodiesterase